jgi:hypothetical protein
LIVNIFLQHPFNLINGILIYYQYFLTSSWFGIYSYLTAEASSYRLIGVILMNILTIAGGISAFLQRKKAFFALALICAAGVFLSVPFVPVRDSSRMRLYAAVMPFLFLLPSIGLADTVNWIWKNNPFQNKTDNVQSLPIILYGCSLAALLLIGTPIIRLTYQPVAPQSINCPAGEDSVSIRYFNGNTIYIREESDFFLDGLPNFHAGRFRLNAHGLPASPEIDEFSAIPSPSAVMNTYDLLSNDRFWLVIDPLYLPAAPGTLGICGHWRNSEAGIKYHFFYARSAQVLAH